MEKPICYEKDFKEIIELFRKCVNDEIEDSSNINTAKLSQEFENNLLAQLQIVPDIDQNQTNKNIKDKITSLQSRAIKIKTDLHADKIAFIENVRTQIEQELNSNHPIIDEFIEEEEEPDELDDAVNILDKRIEELRQDVNKTKLSMDSTLQNTENLLKTASVLPKP